MNKPRKITFGTVQITPMAKELIMQALETGRVSSGRLVREFEEKFAQVMGSKEAVALSSGTDADALALAVLYDFGAVPGDEVVVPALSFVATGNAVLQARFKPVFVDVDRNTLNIDPDSIESVISERTRAIMPVHLMGKAADMDPILSIAEKHGLKVIEDAAEAYGTVYKRRKAGTMGLMGAFSLYVAHMITAVEGGIVISDDGEIAGILRSLRSHGRACKCESCVLNIASGYCARRFDNPAKMDIRFQFERIGFSCKMNELEAAVGLGSIELYSEILEKRRKNLRYMLERFKKFTPYLYTIEEGPKEEIGPHAFPIILTEEAPFTRDSFVYYLEKMGIETRNLFLSMPTQCPGFKFLGYREGMFLNAEYIGRNGLHLGIHQDLDEADIEYIIATIEDFLKQNI